MITITILDKEMKNWLINYLKSKDISFFNFSIFFILNKSNKDIVDKIKSGKYSFVDSSYGFDDDIIKFDFKNKIRNYNLSNKLYHLLKDRKFKLITNEFVHLDTFFLSVSIYKNNDLLLYCETELTKENNDLIKKIDLIKEGKIFMSDEKKEKIKIFISNFLGEFDLSVKDYYISIEEISDNFYNAHLEKKSNGKKILVNDIIFDNKDNIIKVGKYKGLVI